MQVVRCMALIGCLILGAGAQARGIAVKTTLINYQSGSVILLQDGLTDRGKLLPFSMTMQPSNQLKTGATSASVARESLPEWIDVKWQELAPARYVSSTAWYKLSESERDAYTQECEDLPLKSARIEIRNRIPTSVIAELEQAPPDPERANLPSKSLWLYFIWTRDGVKFRWEATRGCCTLLQEGGDLVR